MKKTLKLTMLFLLLGVVNSFSYNSLRIQNPDEWYSYEGQIVDATLAIKPAGIYMQCDLFLEFSSGNYSSNFGDANTDSVEVQYYFDLPKNAIVTDSWLWVEQDIVIADIQDRWTANDTYEGIVNRRQDPSILYKNSDTQYELRVYPLVANSTRKVKISYLIPTIWTASNVTADVSLGHLEYGYDNNLALQELDVIIYEDSVWTSPNISGVASLGSGTTQNSENYKTTTIAQDQFSQPLHVSFNSPLTNGLYVQKYPTTATTGYYQMALLPSSLISASENRKIAIAFDHVGTRTASTEEAIWGNTKLALKNNLVDTDSFNVVYTKFVTKLADEQWLPATDAVIDSVFDAVWQDGPLRSQASIPSLLSETISFIESHGGEGSVLLVSSSAGYSSKETADVFVEDFIAHSDNFPVNIVDYSFRASPYTYLGGKYYYGNEYLYEQLASETEGGFFLVRDSGSLFSSLNSSLSSVLDAFSVYDVSTDIAGVGFTYSDFELTPGDLLLNQGYMKVGKYFQNGDFNVSLVVEKDNGLEVASVSTTEMHIDKDSVTYQAWASEEIDTYGTVSLTNNEIGNIIELSLESRVLTRYTAFLALDPNEFDNVNVCNDCYDDQVVIGLPDKENATGSLQLSVFPNPIEDQMNVKIQLPKSYNDLTGKVQLFTADGKVLLELDIEGADIEQNIDVSLSSYGLDLESGIYLLTVNLGEFSETIKVHKK